MEDGWGRPATRDYAQSYALSYGFMFTMAYDNSYQLDPYSLENTIPLNIFIDLGTMQILDVQHGFDYMYGSMRDDIQYYLSRISR